MKHAAIVPAEVDFSDPSAPRAPRFEDRYHAPCGAMAQARHVFLGGNRLPGRWQGRDAFTVLETGFGLGNNFLATWAAWRADPRRSRRLCFVSIEKHPLRAADLRRALDGSDGGRAGEASVVERGSVDGVDGGDRVGPVDRTGRTRSPQDHDPEGAIVDGGFVDDEVRGLAAQLCAAWPPLTPDLHRLAFEDGRVELLLAFGEASDRLREIVASVDAFFLDGFAPRLNPDMWSPAVFKALARLAAPGATAATWSAARAVRDGLQQAGFAWRRADGIGGKFDITLAEFAPRVRARAPVARVGDDRLQRVAIVGGGLAGAACAQALARAGLRCVVLDAHAEPASGASGNVAGLFHGVFHPDDGLHARAHRAAALLARPAYGQAIAQGVPGRCDGLVRLAPEHPDAAPLAAALAASGLPPDYVQAWSPPQVRAAGGPPCAAWFYPGGGWIAPAELVRSWLQAAGVDWRGGVTVARLERRPADAGSPGGWCLFDDTGGVLADVDAVVLANAGDALALAAGAETGEGMPAVAGDGWIPSLASTRGQVSIVATDVAGLRGPGQPIAGAGYALTLPDGAVMCGATTSPNDAEPSVRVADHAHNLKQLAAVTGSAGLPDDDAARLVDAGRLQGRVGWRATAVDRLPLVGAMPAQPPFDGAVALPDQPRHWPRVPGLFIAAGLGSRGLTWAPLIGRLIESWITGAPFPLPADLIDALDPARFATRTVRASRRPGAGA